MKNGAWPDLSSFSIGKEKCWQSSHPAAKALFQMSRPCQRVPALPAAGGDSCCGHAPLGVTDAVSSAPSISRCVHTGTSSPLRVRGKMTFFLFTMNKRDVVKDFAPCVCTEISREGSSVHCSKPMQYFRVQSHCLMAGWVTTWWFARWDQWPKTSPVGLSGIAPATDSIPLCRGWVLRQRCHPKAQGSPLPPRHPRVPATVLLRVWGVAGSLDPSFPLQMWGTAEAHNTWTL